MGKKAAFWIFLLLVLAAASGFELKESRSEMLAYYHAYIEPKIPKTAKAIIGDEKINVKIGGKVLGIETKRGELAQFDLQPVPSPTIEVEVSDESAQAIMAKKSGILREIEKGGITIRANSPFSALKVEVVKRIYAVSGADDILSGKKPVPQTRGLEYYNSIYSRRVKIYG
jgi:hypothetical protein